jgi:hypothetical protein
VEGGCACSSHTPLTHTVNKQKFKLESHLSHFRGFFDKAYKTAERRSAKTENPHFDIGFGRSVCKEVTAVAVPCLNVTA